MPNGEKSCTREYNWTSMCDAMPYWKGQEMKRSYYSCIRYEHTCIPSIVRLHDGLPR